MTPSNSKGALRRPLKTSARLLIAFGAASALLWLAALALATWG